MPATAAKTKTKTKAKPKAQPMAKKAAAVNDARSATAPVAQTSTGERHQNEGH